MAGDMTFDPNGPKDGFRWRKPESLPFAFSQAIL